MESVYLRSRYYSPLTGRFFNKDTWQGDNTRPITYNGWLYAYADPIIYKDPTGLYPDRYIFYFPGAGNRGDEDQDGNLFNNIDNEPFLRQINDNLDPKAEIFVLFPYGTGQRDIEPIQTSNEHLSVLASVFNQILSAYSRIFTIAGTNFGDNSIPKAKALEIEMLLSLDNSPNQLNYIPRCGFDNNHFDNGQIDLTLIGYSGGGTMAYSTAQELSGNLFVDRLIMFGGVYMAYNGLNNIGDLWEFIGENDTWYGVGGSIFSWNSYNMGMRQEGQASPWVYHPELNIFKQGAKKCILLSGNTPYGHYSYFDNIAFDAGMECDGQNYPPSGDKRGQTNANHISDIITGKLK